MRLHAVAQAFVLLFWISVSAVAATAASHLPAPPGPTRAGPESPDAVAYRDALVTLIHASRRIIIVEHSNHLDLGMVNGVNPPRRSDRVYATHVLSPLQQAAFGARVARVPGVLSSGYDSCAFVPHHALFFYPKSGKPIRIEVCFHCGEIKWPAHPGKVPDGMIEALEDTVRAVGLSPERDWKALLSAPPTH